MSHAAANRGSLARRQPRTLRILDDLPPALGKLDIIPTPGGDPTAVRDGLLIHSRHDPRREAAGQVAAGIDDSATSALILGFGLGYGAEAVRQRFPGLPILVLEPDAGMFKAALDARDLTGILADERVSFLVGEPPEEISSMLAALPLAKPAFLRLRPALQRDPQWFRAAEEVVRSWLLRRDININTLSRFGRLWVRNLVRNMPAFAAVPGIARLEGLFSGVPALVLARRSLSRPPAAAPGAPGREDGGHRGQHTPEAVPRDGSGAGFHRGRRSAVLGLALHGLGSPSQGERLTG